MTWQIDKSRSRLGFSVKHMMVSTTKGTFNEYEAELLIDEQDLSKSSARAIVKTRSVDTKDKLRDDYLVSDNFFKPSEFPEMVFQSTNVRVRGNKITVTGTMKIRDKERSLILEGTSSGPSARFGKRTLSFSLTGEIDRDAFGLVFHGAVESVSVVVGKKVKLDLQIELVEA